MPTKNAMIVAGITQMNRSAAGEAVGRLLERERLVHRHGAGVGPERRVRLVVQQVEVGEDAAVVGEPLVLHVPDALVALAGEQHDEPLHEREDLCEVAPDLGDDEMRDREDDP